MVTEKQTKQPQMSSNHFIRGGLDSSPPQSPGAESQQSFNSTMQIYDPRRGTVTSIDGFSSSPSTYRFLPEKKGHTKMRTWESRKIRQLTAFLVFFVLVAVVVSALFAWREIVSRRHKTNGNAERKDGITQTPSSAHNSCKFKATPVPMHPLPESIQKQLDSMGKWLKEVPSQHLGAVMANVVYMDKIIWNVTVGKMDPNSKASIPPTSRTPFPIASLTKIITALMLFKLYDEKRISLDDELKEYLPDFSIIYLPNSHEIVLRELASQMAGVPREAPCYPQTKSNLCPYNDTVMIERIKKLQLVEKPGAHPVYSNLGFGLLGRVLAKWLNTTFEKWTEENIFKSFGMEDSFFKLTPELTKKIPVGKQDEVPTDWGWLNPAGGGFVSVQDLAKLEIELFDTADNESFLSSVTKDEFFAPAFVHGKDLIVGTPWEMELMDGYVGRHKNGYIYGYFSRVFLIPELKLGMNIFWTGMLDVHILFYHLKSLHAAFHEELTKRDPMVVNPPPVSPSSYVGVYKPRDIPTIDKVEIQEANAGRLNLVVVTATRDSLTFQLNFLKGNTFEVIDRNRICLALFMTGINHDRVYFNSSSNTNGRFNEFFVFGIHPRGKATFTRVQ